MGLLLKTLFNALLRRTVCDICAEVIQTPGGYLLTTRQVVTNPEYWQFMFATVWASQLKGANSPNKKHQLAQHMASQSTPWLVCASCANRLGRATPQALSDAQRWWNQGKTVVPEGSGPVPVEEVRQLRPSVNVVQSGLPMASKVFLVGSKTQPARDDFLIAANGLIEMHPPLTMEHLYGVFIEPSSTSTADVSDLTNAVGQILRRSHGSWLVDSICLIPGAGRHLAIVAMWSGEAAEPARKRLPKGTLGGAP